LSDIGLFYFIAYVRKTAMKVQYSTSVSGRVINLTNESNQCEGDAKVND